MKRSRIRHLVVVDAEVVLASSLALPILPCCEIHSTRIRISYVLSFDWKLWDCFHSATKPARVSSFRPSATKTLPSSSNHMHRNCPTTLQHLHMWGLQDLCHGSYQLARRHPDTPKRSARAFLNPKGWKKFMAVCPKLQIHLGLGRGRALH
eukprot:3080061-Amphidinium_carterae.1